MPPPIKKKKNIYRPNQTKKKCVDPGSRGLFFTCENEKQAVKEARNLIDKYLSTAEPSDENEAGDEYNEDVSETLNKLCKGKYFYVPILLDKFRIFRSFELQDQLSKIASDWRQELSLFRNVLPQHR